MSKDHKDIRFFLSLGYFPDYDGEYPLAFSGIEKLDADTLSHEDILQQCKSTLISSIEKDFIKGKRHVVPLSGGLSSRALLCALSEFTELRNIETYTFGIRGTCDYDIGCQVAEIAETQHTAVDLCHVEWTMDMLFELADKHDGQTLLFGQAPQGILERFSDEVIWSGYMGGSICGGHLTSHPSNTIEDAKTRYIKQNILLRLPADQPEQDLMTFIGGGDVPADVLSYDEQVIFSEAEKSIAPRVLSGREQCYRTPFIHSPFFDFMLSLPKIYRRKRVLFREMCHTSYPSLFDLPTTSYHGLRYNDSIFKIWPTCLRNGVWRMAKNTLRFLDMPPVPTSRRFDFDTLIRRNKSLQNVAQEALMDLKDRDCVNGVNIDVIWHKHMDNKRNYGDALFALLSLEMNLKVLEMREERGTEKQKQVG